MVDPIKLPIPTPPPNADAHARADTERNRRLFDWAEAVLKALGLDMAVAAARSIEDLRWIALDVNSAEIALALRDALHPTSGQRQEHFRGLREGSLKAILRNRFTVWKKDREATLRRGKAPKSDWTDQLILDKDGKICPILANLILILREASRWKGVLGYDEFAARVVIKRPRLGVGRRWIYRGAITMNCWPVFGFRTRELIRPRGMWGGRCKRRLDTAPSIPCEPILTPSCGTAYPAWTHGSLLTSTSRIAHTSARSGHVTRSRRLRVSIGPAARLTMCSCSKGRRVSRNPRRCARW